MTDTLTKPTRFKCFVNRLEQEAPGTETSGMEAPAESTSVFRRMVERTIPIFYSTQELGRQHEWEFNLVPPAHDLFATFPVFSEPVLQTEVEDLDLIFHCCRQETVLNRQYLATCLLEMEWNAPDPYELWSTSLWQQGLAGFTIPDSLSPAILHTMEIGRTFSPARIGPAVTEIDPEVEGEWWVTVPIWFKGSPSETLAMYQSITHRFVKEVPASDRHRIRLDVKILE